MQQNEQAPNIKGYLIKILRRKYVALSVGLAVLSLFTWGSFLLPKTYEASAIISIEMNSVYKPLIQGVAVFGDEDRIQNLKNEITSRNIIEKTVKKLGMDAYAKKPEQYDLLIESIKKKMEVKDMGMKERSERPTMFNISYTGADPKTVTQVVDTITNVYIDERTKSRRTETSEAYEFIQNQVLELKNRLQVEGLQSSKIETDRRMKELMRKKEDFQKQLSGEKELSAAIISREGSPQARLNTLNNQLMILMTKYTESYPEVIKVKAEIEELKKLISQAKDSHIEGGSETPALNPVYQQILKEELAKTEDEIESLRGRSSELSKQHQDPQRMFGRMPEEQEERTKLQRDRKVHQQIYDQLLQKLENARVSKEIEIRDKGESFRIVEPAKLPLFPVKPNRIKLILLGILWGIASGIGVVFVLDYLDHSFKDEDSIETSLKLPVLATIPKIITEAEEISAKRLERKVFIVSGAYLCLIGLVLIGEFLSRYMGIRINLF